MNSIAEAEDLVTSQEMRVAGFIEQAAKKLSKAEDFYPNANSFRQQASKLKSIEDVRANPDLYDFTTKACMLSKKSLNNLSDADQDSIIDEIIDFDRLDNIEYLSELERRYFLTSGDALGGAMRNFVGQFAQEKLTEAIFQRLIKLNKTPENVREKNKEKITAIKWDDKRIIFDKKPKFIGKSIDIIVVQGDSAAKGDLENPSDYLCCGELKGGNDPAGADEHWKTAHTALNRIRTAFTEKEQPKPKLIFIGAAIERSMAEEIFQLLDKGWLAGAANINYDAQLTEVIDIIIGEQA